MRFESETASLPHVPARTSSVSGNTQAVSLGYVHCSGCSEFYCDASEEFCLTSLWVLSLFAEALKKEKISVAVRQSVHLWRTFVYTSKFILPPLDSAFDRVKVNSIRPSARYAAGGLKLALDSDWLARTTLSCTKSPRLRQLAEWKETKKKIPELFQVVHVSVEV